MLPEAAEGNVVNDHESHEEQQPGYQVPIDLVEVRPVVLVGKYETKMKWGRSVAGDYSCEHDCHPVDVDGRHKGH